MINNKKTNKNDSMDDDLYEELDDEELERLINEAREEALQKERHRKEKKKRPAFPKWMFWVISFMLLFNVIALIPQTFSIPAIDFLITSAKLSTDKQVSNYKKSVVVVETDDSRGTGFSITDKGLIITNHHVVENEDRVTISFKEEGLFHAEVIKDYPDIDLAVLQTDTNETLPHLTLAEKMNAVEGDPVYFVGNPLRFTRIANEGNILEPIQLEGWEEEVMMMEAPVYRGNSGSPVINRDDEVIGIVFATLDEDTYGKVGLFIPIDYYYEKTGSL